MGVYIRNKEKPNSCSECFYALFCAECKVKAIINKSGTIYYTKKKPEDCPMIEIDEDKIKQLL